MSLAAQPSRFEGVRTSPGPTRRAVLVAGPALVLAAGPALVLAAACTADQPAPRSAPPVDPDDALRSAAAERERALLREYDAVLTARPGLAPRLVPVRGHHAEHLDALLDQSPASTTPSPAPTAAVPPAVPPPVDDAAALARLVAAERTAGDAHARDCLTASRALAPVLASLSASEHSHPVALT
jgi:hypothetical protein